jgi:hypothetical protein
MKKKERKKEEQEGYYEPASTDPGSGRATKTQGS